MRLNDADRELVSKVVGEAGACAQCALRFTGDRSPRGYVELEAVEAAAGAAKRARPSQCSVCLGVLQHTFMVARLDQVVEEVAAGGYDATQFSLSLSLPISLALRQHALWLHLVDRLPASCLSGLSQKDVVPIKQVWKYLFPDLVAERVSLEHQTGDVTDFFVELVVEWEGEEEELGAMVHICREEYATRARNVHVYNMGVYSRQGVEKSLGGVTMEQFALHYPVPPAPPSSTFRLGVRMTRGSVYLAGRYCKYSRDLPQTPWIIQGVRKCETSVEEVLAAPALAFLGAAEAKFLASGREDVDVRMLGAGRPFALELVNPKKTRLSPAEAAELERRVNLRHPGVRVNSLQVVGKAAIAALKEGEEDKRKRYTALCVTAAPVAAGGLEALEAMGEVRLAQETPVRVLHRRSNAVREKVVLGMKADRGELGGNMFTLDVLTSAGTYVKELVHGDFARTNPSLSTLLGVPTDILALDVEEVYLDWPPKLET